MLGIHQRNRIIFAIELSCDSGRTWAVLSARSQDASWDSIYREAQRLTEHAANHAEPGTMPLIYRPWIYLPAAPMTWYERLGYRLHTLYKQLKARR